MKKNSFLYLSILSLVVLSCAQGSNETEKNLNNQNETSTSNEISTDSLLSDSIDNQAVEEKFLITQNSVGYFKLGSAWQSFAKNDYNYEFVEGIGSCVDACCNGGHDVGKELTVDEYGWVENAELTIGATLFKDAETFEDEIERKRFKDNKDVFYITSDNCMGWYYKDKVRYIIVYSTDFKTSEGIGVGTTLEAVKEITNEFTINIGWLEEDANAVQLVLKKYPTIKFILDVEDAKGGYEKLSTLGETAKISDFKKETKIRSVIVSE